MKQIESKKWSDELIKNLVDKIREGRIVPVIGSGAFEVNGFDSVQEYVVTSLAEKHLEGADIKDCIESCSRTGIKGMTILNNLFSQKEINLKVELRNFFGEKSNLEKIFLKKEVRSFLENGSFPLVLTTCYFVVLDNILFYNDSHYLSVQYRRDKSDDQDIPIDVERNPTIYYLFGNLSLTDTTYLVNETDLLDYIHSYLGPNAPYKLKTFLKSRYLLTLGCEIPDWTFRFMLYSLKDGNLIDKDGATNSFIGGAVATSGMETDLSFFLHGIKYQSGDEIREILSQISGKLIPQNKKTIFLSVSSKEYNSVGKEICNRLSMKFKVWFFPNNSDPQYWDRIKQGISKCDYFMPVITDNALVKLLKLNSCSEIKPDESSGLLAEWKLAAEHKKKIGKSLYCVPFFMETDIIEFQNELSRREVEPRVLWPLFFPDEGAAALPISNIEELSAEIVWNHLNLNNK